jgi:hypothetical protein
MKSINAAYKNPTTGETETRTFRTNESGANLFTGVGENRQISCESGFHSLKRMKKAIRSHLRFRFGCDHGEPELGRITYTPSIHAEFIA